MQISHEAIYRSLFIQTRGVLKKELTAQLRTVRRMLARPIREVLIHDKGFMGSRLSMMRIIARRTKAATVGA